MKTYRHSNGRIMKRDSNGRFRNFTFQDFGIETNSTYLICGSCGHGEKEKWIPILKTGKCPKCDNQDNHKEKEITLSEKAEELIAKIEVNIKERIKELEEILKNVSGMTATNYIMKLNSLRKLEQDGAEAIVEIDLKHEKE